MSSDKLDKLSSLNEINFNTKNIKKQKSLEYLISLEPFDQTFINLHLVCRICKNILNNPKQCSECEENFCEKCYTDFISINESCINSCTNSTAIKTHPAVINFLEKLHFKCIYNNQEIISYGEIERHLTSVCKYRMKICKNLDCDFTSQSPEILNQHIENCLFEIVSCPICKSVFKKKDVHNCSEFFLAKLQSTRDEFKGLNEEYSGKLKELEDLAEHINREIMNKSNSNGKIKNF
jgi:hypothetical protein